MARSVNLETYCRLDTGLKLVNSESTPDVLSRGEFSASFQQSGNSPDVREQVLHRDRRQQATLELDQVDKIFLQIVEQASGLRPH